MAYTTASALRERYRRGLDGDEFAGRDDADLEQAIAAASAEIDRWRPAGALTAADLAVLADVALPLARQAMYKESALDSTHPIVVDAANARAWLRALAAGTVRLPSSLVAGDAVPATPATDAPDSVFGPDFVRRYRGPV